MGENNTIIKIQKFIEELCGISLNEDEEEIGMCNQCENQ